MWCVVSVVVVCGCIAWVAVRDEREDEREGEREDCALDGGAHCIALYFTATTQALVC